jgi:hypothetical protein
MQTSYVHPTILFRYLQTTVAYAICFVGHLSINQTLELETPQPVKIFTSDKPTYPGSGAQWLAIGKW